MCARRHKGYILCSLTLGHFTTRLSVIISISFCSSFDLFLENTQFGILIKNILSKEIKRHLVFLFGSVEARC